MKEAIDRTEEELTRRVQELTRRVQELTRRVQELTRLVQEQATDSTGAADKLRISAYDRDRPLATTYQQSGGW